MIFKSFEDLKRNFGTSDKKIKTALEKGLPLLDETTGQKWYVDILVEETE